MDVLEATLRILCMTDGKEGLHTLERQEEFVEIVKSRDVEVNIVHYIILFYCTRKNRRTRIFAFFVFLSLMYFARLSYNMVFLQHGFHMARFNRLGQPPCNTIFL